VPIIIAGGKKIENEMDVFEMAYQAIQQGAAGCDFGRNIFQNPHPVAMISALKAIVHNNTTPTEAQEIYNDLGK